MNLRYFLQLVVGLVVSFQCLAQISKDSAKTIVPKKFEELIKSNPHADSGLINIYKQDDKIFFELPLSLLSRDILVVTRLSKGSIETRTMGGMNGYKGDEVNNCIINFEKSLNNKILIKQISYSERSNDSTKDLYNAVLNSTLQPIVASFDIKAFSNSDTGYLIDVTEYLNGDNDILFFNSSVKSSLSLGGIQPDKSYINSARSYANNVTIKTVKTYTRSSPNITGFTFGGFLGYAPSSTITVEINSSLVLLPYIPMQPRYADQRVGYFSVSYTDFDLNPQGINRVSLIKRWRLEPKDSEVDRYLKGEIVEPKKPIIFYIDPATPKKWIPYLIKGVDDWQVAFEKAGFKHAIYAREAPTNAEDSTWNLEDATLSAIVYKPSSIANASGPSISDPRTGEILESHINWYHNVMELLHDWYMIQASPSDARARKMVFDDSLMGQLIRFVSSHEVGHTLGLLHNFGASSTVPVDSLRNKQWVEQCGHTPSIMDYARFNYVAQPEDSITEKGIFPRINDYDKWAIEWGYKWLAKYKTPEEEKEYLNKWLIEKNKDKRLWFGSELNLTDPRDQSEAVGDDAVKASMYGIKNLKFILPNLLSWTLAKNEGYENLDRMYNQLISQFSKYVGHVLRNVGGQLITPKTVEQDGSVYEFVHRDVQKKSMAFLNSHVLHTPSWIINKDILKRIGITPIEIISRIQSPVIRTLLSTKTISNIIDAETIDGFSAYTVREFLDYVKTAVWDELDAGKTIEIYRRILQKQYLMSLFELAEVDTNKRPDGNNPTLPGGSVIRARGNISASDISSLARAQIIQLQLKIAKAILLTKDDQTKNHLKDCLFRITQILKV